MTFGIKRSTQARGSFEELVIELGAATASFFQIKSGSQAADAATDDGDFLQRWSQSTERSMLASVGRPDSAIAISNSPRRMLMTRATPCSPPAAKP